jgi:hypothetical protein
MNIQNYGLTKTIVEENGRYSENEMKWKGNYDGNIANIDVDINDDGFDKHVSMQLDNNDLVHLLGIQPIEKPLEQRLMNDFLSYPKKTRKYRKYKRSKYRKYNSRKYNSRKHNSRNKKRYEPLLIEGAFYPK